MITSIILAVAICVFVFDRLLRAFRLRRHAKQLRCEAPKKGDNTFFGIPGMMRMLAATRENRFTEYQLGQYETKFKANTFKVVFLGKTIILTREPENVKALLATQFNDFRLGDRYNQLHPFLGDGIFTLDGKGWSTARAFLRPQFSKDQVSILFIIGRKTKQLARSY